MFVVILSLLLLAATIASHYEALRFASKRLARLNIAPRLRIIVILVAALASHITHVLIYATAFFLTDRYTTFGSIRGAEKVDFGAAIYFSITSYTTLGIGDLYPTGALRWLSGLEALTGLVMVGWTASMTYLFMEKFWHLHIQNQQSR